MARRRIGVFGGTFDPPHRGHVSVAGQVADTLRLDEVIWMPAGDPPHKHQYDLTPAPVRLRMVRAAAVGDARFRTSEMEVRRDGPSYTIDTLRALQEEIPDADLFLIVGIDQYHVFDTWHRPHEIRALATLAVMDRGGESASPSTEDVVPVPVSRIDVSSTRVRGAVDRGDAIDDMVPPEVRRIIEAEGLYRRERA